MLISVALTGLTSTEAASRLVSHGPNALPEGRPTPLWVRFARQFRSPLIYILIFAFVFDMAIWLYEGGIPVEALAIAAILLLNASLGTVQEHRSERALAELKAMAAPLAWALRDGRLARIPSHDIVPGDVIRVEAGERVPADGRLLEVLGVMVDEAVLTGESIPVDKALGDDVFSGTLVVRGKGFFEVAKTGVNSSMGRLATMLGTIQAEQTPLEKRLAVFGHQIARWVGGLAALLAVAGVAAEGLSRFGEVLLFAIALAVAAVPEGMPAVVTLTLALGVQRMARRHAVVRRLSAVEALGSVTVIATDKTGTLTENQMRVQRLDAHDEHEALLAMALANDADLTAQAGDPLELGLLSHARDAGLDIDAVRTSHRRIDARPFDSMWKYMRVTVESGSGVRSYIKGAPEVVLERSRLTDEERSSWTQRAEAAANAGYRVLAFAGGDGNTEKDLTVLGLALLWDPPRPEVPDAIRLSQRAGVRVLMITGDHPGTARAVAEAIGIDHPEVATGDQLDRLSSKELQEVVRRASVFARVSPEHKLRLVEALQANGDIVAMTGDGVNDAPALKRADVGVAMGQRGSDVTREVADLVLLDDNFASIVGAIEEGRGIYENIQKFIRFLFSTNVALVALVVFGAVGAFVMDLREGAGFLLLPLTAIQLLWINFVADGPPALALALDHSPDVMNRPPRPPSSPLLDVPSRRFIVSTGLLKAAAGGGFLVFLPTLGYGVHAVRTAVFVFESLAQLVFAYPSRRLAERPLPNPTLHVVVGVSALLQISTVMIPSLRLLLNLEPLDARAWALVLGGVACLWLLADLLNRWIGRSPREGNDSDLALPGRAGTRES